MTCRFLVVALMATLPGLGLAAPAAPAAPGARTPANAAVPASSAAPAPAAQPENPFAAVVPVPDDSDKSRDKGLRDALVDVLKRVSGKTDAAASSIVSRASSLVQAYGFQKDPATQAVSFRATFDPDGVQDALRAEGLPVFGVNANVIEAWVVEVHGVNESREFARLLDYFSSLRGVRRVDVEEVRSDALRLRMTVEGGVDRVAVMVAGGGVVREQAPGLYELVR